MTYSYQCTKCEKDIIIEKSIYQSSREEHCEVCNSILKRIYQSPSIKTTDGVKK